MMNAAMIVAPAPQMAATATGGKIGPVAGQLFDQAMAQQQQVVSQVAKREAFDLKGLPEIGALLNGFSELLETGSGEPFALQPQQQELLEQLEHLDRELLDRLALLLEQGMIPNAMDQARLQQLAALVEEALPQWNPEMAGQIGEQGLLLESFGPETEQGDTAINQKIDKLTAWFSPYQEPQQGRSTVVKGTGSELPPGQLMIAHRLEQLRERLTQLKTARSEAGNTADPVELEGEVNGPQPAATAARAGDLVEGQGSSLEMRFGDLLKPRPLQADQPQAVSIREAGRQQQSALTDESAGFLAKVADQEAPRVSIAQALMNAKQRAESLPVQPGHLHGQPAPVATVAQGLTAPTGGAAPFTASLPAADSQIFDQVVTHLSGSNKGDMGRMVLRLHPAELGSLRIELMVEGDRVRANLHAQTQQVQDVLERHLGQLRNALAEQGLKIDHFQVSSDARHHQQQGPYDNLAQQRHGAEQSAQHRRTEKEEPLREDQAIPLAHLTQNGGRGISLHV